MKACGCGLPVITTPMGAGRIVRDNKEGFVIEPYDAARWISAIRTLAEDLDVVETWQMQPVSVHLILYGALWLSDAVSRSLIYWQHVKIRIVSGRH